MEEHLARAGNGRTQQDAGTSEYDSERLTVRILAVPGSETVTIELSGIIDAQSCGDVVDAMQQALASGTPERIVLDLAELDFCDCAGLRALVAAHGQAVAGGIRCTVENPRDNIRWLFECTGAGELLTD